MGSVASYFYTPAQIEVVESVCPSNTPEPEILTNSNVVSIIDQQEIQLEQELINHFGNHHVDVSGILQTLDDFSIACKKNRKNKKRRYRHSLK